MNNTEELNTEVFPLAFTGKGTIDCYDEDEARRVFMRTDGLKPLLDAVEKEARNLVANPNTTEGRKQITEMADKVKRAARNLDKFRADTVKELKEMPKRIDEGGRVARTFLENLAEEIRRPVTEIDAREDRLRFFVERPAILTAAPSRQLAEELEAARNMDVSEETWKESAKSAIAARESVVDALETLLAKRMEEEKKQAEFEEFQRKQAEEKRQKELEEARQQGIREAEARAKAEAEQKERDRIAKENDVAELKAKAESAPARPAQTANAKQESTKSAKQATQSVTPYEEAYADMKEAFRSAGFADPIYSLLTAIKTGKIRHVTANI